MNLQLITKTNFIFETKEIRTLVDTETKELWFFAKDVFHILGITSKGGQSDALKFLDDDERGSFKTNTSGGVQSMEIVSESGLYSLIMRSRKKIAKPFKKWVTKEVIPNIRKNGFYISKHISTEHLFFAKEKINETIEETRYSLDLVKLEFQKTVIDFLKDDPNFTTDKERAGVLGYLTDSIYLVANLKTASSKKQDYLLENDKLVLQSTNQLRKNPKKQVYSDNYSAINMMYQEELQSVKTVYIQLMDNIRGIKKHRFSEKTAPVLRRFISGILLEIFKTIPTETVEKHCQFFTVDTKNLNYIIRKILSNCLSISEYKDEIEKLSTRKRRISENKKIT
jgi:prophage antirepressor-like protein